MKYPESRLLVFTRAPVAGQVKTRLVPLLGEQGAADFHARLVHRCLETVTGTGLCPVDLWCSPSIDEPFFQSCRTRYGVRLQRQIQGNLGQRMQHALVSALQTCRGAVLVGTDCPSLTSRDLDASLNELQRGTEVVLGPARDGGYYLIGGNTAEPLWFTDIPWGTSAVLGETVARLHRAGVGYHCLDERQDVDTPADYRRLHANGVLSTHGGPTAAPGPRE
jgi:rSAM/selenodomain-associated transferase 1